MFQPKIKCMNETILQILMSYIIQGSEGRFLQTGLQECLMFYEPPEGAYSWSDSSRFVCQSDDIKPSCNLPRNSHDYQACHSYRAPLRLKPQVNPTYSFNTTEDISFYNSHCARCWGIMDQSHLTCFMPKRYMRRNKSRYPPILKEEKRPRIPSFSLLLDFSDRGTSGLRVKLGDDLVCPSDTLRDINNDKCVVSRCPKAHIQVNESCVRLDDQVQQPLTVGDRSVSIFIQVIAYVADTQQYHTFLELINTNLHRLHTVNTLDQHHEMLTVKVSECHKMWTSRLIGIDSSNYAPNDTVNLSLCVLAIKMLTQTNYLSFIEKFHIYWKPLVKEIYENINAIFWELTNIPIRSISVGVFNFDVLAEQLQCSDGSTLVNRKNVEVLEDGNGAYVMFVNETGQYVYNLSNVPMSYTKHTVMESEDETWLMGRFLSVDDSNTFRSDNTAYICEANILTCQKSRISLANVKHERQEQTLTLELKGELLILTQHNYILLKNDILIYCSDAITRVREGTNQPLSVLVQSWMTLMGIILSLVGLSLTLFTYYIFPNVRNTPGKSIMNLCLALFMAQILFLVSYQLVRFPKGCTVSAALQHYFWLSSFTWMTILAADICGTFVKMKVTQRQNSARFRWYLACGWGVPLTFMAVCVGVDLGTSLDFDYGDDTKCWIAGSYLSVVYIFAIPVALSVLVSMGLFITTVLSLRQTMKIAQRATKTNDNTTHFKIYVRLCSIMGFTWIFGFLANWKPLWFMTFPFIIFNTLQGVFIFGSFVTNRRILVLYRRKWYGGGGIDSETKINTASSMSTHM